MRDACRCRAAPAPARPAALAAPVDPEQTVADLLAARPESREILQRLGVNHCCGAHLRLREGAAAAGIPIDRLLEALGARAS